MKWLTKLFKKDDFLDELGKNPDLYQRFFEKLAEIADDKLWAKFVLNSEFAFSDIGIEQIEKEEKKTLPILHEAENSGLNQTVLLVAYLQYAVADPLFDQDAKKLYWVSVIQNRKSVDSFPHHNAIVDYLDKCGYIGKE